MYLKRALYLGSWISSIFPQTTNIVDLIWWWIEWDVKFLISVWFIGTCNFSIPHKYWIALNDRVSASHTRCTIFHGRTSWCWFHTHKFLKNHFLLIRMSSIEWCWNISLNAITAKDSILRVASSVGKKSIKQNNEILRFSWIECKFEVMLQTR